MTAANHEDLVIEEFGNWVIERRRARPSKQRKAEGTKAKTKSRQEQDQRQTKIARECGEGYAKSQNRADLFLSVAAGCGGARFSCRFRFLQSQRDVSEFEQT